MSSKGSSRPRGLRKQAAVLAVLGFLVLIPGSAIMPLLDRDEPKFSEATREMMLSGDWIVPHFNDDYRFDKPVLTYWLMSLGYRLFGVSEFGARFHSIVATVLLALAVLLFGRSLVGQRAAFWGALMLLLSVQFFVHGRAAVADMPMVLAVALAQFGIFRLLFGEQDERKPWFWMTYLALGLGFLAKGPIALLVPLLSLLLFWLFTKRAALPLAKLRPVGGCLLALAIVAPWGIRALVETDFGFWRTGIGRHVVDRGMKSFNDRLPIPGYYLLTYFLSAAPWAAWIGYLVVWLRRNWSREHAYLAAWWLAPYLIFTFYKTQLPHYVLPGLPACFLLMGKMCDQGIPEAGRWSLRMKRLILGIYGAVIVAGLLTLALVPLTCVRLFGLALALIAAGLLAATPLVRSLNLRAVVLAVVLLAAGGECLGRALRVQHVVLALQDEFRRLPADASCGYWGFREPSIVFYSQRFWNDRIRRPVHVQYALYAQYDLLVALEQQVKAEDWVKAKLTGTSPKFKDKREELDLLDTEGYEVVHYEGLNVAHGSWVKLRVFRRTPQ